MSKSKIEWTGKTWNPVVGCDKISPGCKNCYAIRMAYRLMHNPKMAGKYAGTAIKTASGDLNWTGKINVVDVDIPLPFRDKVPTLYFVNSMSDLFHEAVPFDFIDQVFAIMALSPQHTFQILTKRPQRMVDYYNSRNDSGYFEKSADEILCNNLHLFHVIEKLGTRTDVIPHITNELLTHLKKAGWHWDTNYDDDGNREPSTLIYEGEYPLKNVWIGVSVESQKEANERIHYLNSIPAAVKFLSCEPLLGPINFTESIGDSLKWHAGGLKNCISWVIVGGESGPGSRPMHPEWAISLRDQCKADGVPFFFKQWGEWMPARFNTPNSSESSDLGQFYKGRNEFYPGSNSNEEVYGDHIINMRKVGKKKAGRLLEGIEYNEMPT